MCSTQEIFLYYRMPHSSISLFLNGFHLLILFYKTYFLKLQKVPIIPKKQDSYHNIMDSIIFSGFNYYYFTNSTLKILLRHITESANNSLIILLILQ